MAQLVEPSQEIEQSGVLGFNFSWENVTAIAVKLIAAIAVIVLMWFVAGVIAGMVRRKIIRNSTGQDEKNAEKIASLIRDVTYYLLISVGVFAGFKFLDIDLGIILGGVSFGVGLAFKEVLGNMIAGMMILYTKEFRLGDVVEVSADKPYFGRIEEITIRYTIIRTLDMRQVVLPNMTLISVPIKTFSAEETVKLDTVIGIHYNSDVAKAISVAVSTINSFQFVKEKENTKVFVTNFGTSAIDLKCLFGFDPNCGLVGDVAVGYANEMIYEQFKANNIAIPYDHVTLIFENAENKKKVLEGLSKVVVQPKASMQVESTKVPVTTQQSVVETKKSSIPINSTPVVTITKQIPVTSPMLPQQVQRPTVPVSPVTSQQIQKPTIPVAPVQGSTPPISVQNVVPTPPSV